MTGEPNLNEREIASAILLAAYVAFALLNPKARGPVIQSLADVAEALWKRAIIITLLAFMGWVVLCVWSAALLGVWRPPLLKDTILTATVVGLPLLFRSLNNKSGVLLWRQVAAEAVGLSALIAFYVNLSPLPLWAELLLQVVVTFLLFSQIAVRQIERSSGQRVVAGCVNVALGLIGLALLVWSTIRLVLDWPTLDQREFFQQLAMSVWLPLALFPFLYGFAYVAAAEGILLRISNRNQTVSRSEKLGIVLGMAFSLRTAKAFVGKHLKLSGPRTFRGALEHAREVRHDLDRREAKRRDQIEGLAANTGVAGADLDGAQIDRREFYITKEALRWLHTCQMGWYERQGNQFWGQDRVDGILAAGIKMALPEPHGIVLDTDATRARWRAWRRLPNGWVLAIGGTSRTDQYLYAGYQPPTSFPGESDEWIDATRQEWPIDWDRNDRLESI